MANIDNLNFGVILTDDEFKKKIDEDMKLAKQLNVSLSALLDLQAKIKQSGIKVTAKGTNDAIRQEKLAAAIARRATAEENLSAAQTRRSAAEERLGRDVANRANAESRAARAAMQTEQAQRRIAGSVTATTRAYQQQSRTLQGLKTMALSYFSIQGASQLLNSLVRVTGEFELQKTTLSAMLGDLNKAEQILSDIKGLAVESPFQFKELATYTKQLSAFAVPAEELYNTTKMLADISAGLGVGMDRIVLAYGQVRSAAFLRGQEVRQFTEAGIPILDELAKQFTELEGRAVSTGEVFDKISARLVPFEMVAKVFKDMTSEGGKFYNMQEVQAETLKGKISNLKDAYEMMLNEIGEGQSEKLKGAVDYARKLMSNYEETGRTLVELISVYGIYRAALIATEVATNTFSVANHKLISSLVKVGASLVANPYAAVAAAVTALGYAFYRAKTNLEPYERLHKELTKSEEKFTNSLSAEQAKLESLYKRITILKEGTDEYKEARKQLFSQYASYISDLKNEGVEVENLATLYDNLKIKIEESSKAKFRAIAQNDIDQKFAEETEKIFKRVKNLRKGLNDKLKFEGKEELDAANSAALFEYINGGLTREDILNNPELKQLRFAIFGLPTALKEAAQRLKNEMADLQRTYAEDIAALSKLYGEAQEDLNEETPAIAAVDKSEEVKKGIETQIRSIQRLQDAYEKLRVYLNDDQLKSTLKTLFPNVAEGVIDSMDFTAELERLAGELERFDKEAAKNLRETISKDVAGSIAETFEAIEAYRSSLDKWFSEDFYISGKGISFDIAKIISDLNTAYNKIDQKRMKNLELLSKAQMGDEEALKLVRETYGEEVWQKYVTNGKRAIEELAYAERVEAKKTADEKIRDLANKYVSEKLTEKNIDTSDLADKTIAQVKTQISRLNELVEQVNAERAKILADIVNGNIVEGQVASWEMLSKVVEILGVKIADLGEEVEEKTLDITLQTIKEVGNLGNELSSLGENLDLAGFAQMGKSISSTTEELSSLMKVIEAEDTVGIVANVLSMFVTRVGDMLTYAYEQQMALNDASREYIEIQNEMRESAYSGIFGTDELGLAIERLEILKETQERYNSTLDEFNKIKFQNTSAGAGNRTFKKTSLANLMSDISSDQGWELYKKDGEINIAALEAYYDAYSSRLSRKQKKLIQTLIEDGNAVLSEAEQQAEYLRSLFSNVADSIADSFIESFKESGEAALDYGDLMDEIATNMAKSVIKSSLLQSVFSDEMAKQAGEKLASGDTAAALALIDKAMISAQALAPHIQDLLKGIEPYLQMEQPETAETLGEGIKGGITEDTASLLSSYVNAMRADLSGVRQLQAQHLPIISAAMPTIMDHLAQINAHTYDTSQNTQQMLSELISLNGKIGDVIGSGSDGSAIKVLM